MATDTGTDETSPRRRPFRRWSLALLVVIVAAAVALWPRANEPAQHAAVSPSSPQPPAVNLATVRAQAQLRPCPSPEPSGSQPVSLRGVRASCLADGASVDVGEVLAGRTTLINVWASWCQVCREELPVLDAYATSPSAVRVLGVQVLSDPADGLDLLTSLNVHLPSVVDTDGTVSNALHLPAYLPVSYLVTADGTVRQVLPPTPFSSPEQVDRTVRAMASGNS